MHFTREPIIETVMTPREGFKLVVRNSKASSVEEYFVDAVEIVSFGNALFFRSMERPKQFMLPVTDYEVLEVRETRIVLKHPEEKKQPAKKAEEEATPPRRRRTTTRRRRKTEEKAPPPAKEIAEEAPSEPKESEEKTPKPMIPPPTSLISENIDRYKEMVQEEPVIAPATGEESESSATQAGGGNFSASRFLRRLTGRDQE